MDAQLSIQGGTGTTEGDLELVLHKSYGRVKEKTTAAVVNANLESRKYTFDRTFSIVLFCTRAQKQPN